MNLGMENETLEFKKSTSELNEGIISLAAMLNKHGEGTLYFGVKNDGSIIGQKNINESTLRDISRKISEGIKPQVIPEIMMELIDNKTIIKVFVKGNKSAYSAFGKYYSRSFDEDKMLEPDALKALMNRDGEPDLIIMRESTKKDLSFKILKFMYVNQGIAINEKNFEDNVGLYTKNNKYNYMAELVADENDLSIKVVTFKGNDKSIVLKRTEYGGKCLLSSVNNVLEYMESINETKVKIGGFKRIEEKYFDFNVFKEAWLNAVVHTKWSEMIPPAVYIYDDRIEVISNGGLPSTLSIEDFYKGISKPVNAKLLKIFRDLDYIDQTGHGVPLIVKKYGEKAFYISDNTVIVTIPINKELLEKEEESKYYYEFSNIEKKLLNEIKNNSNITANELAKKLNISESYVEKIIKKLRENKIIKRIGSNKNGNWIII